MRRTLTTLALVISIFAVAASTAAQAPRALVVQTGTEPPGLDLTATPASATAGVVLYNVQECLVNVTRTARSAVAPSAGTPPTPNYTFFLRGRALPQCAS